MLSYRSLRTHRLRCVACVTLHTNRVSLMHSVVCIVYVERYVQTIHIPVDTPASEVFSRPSTQIVFAKKKILLVYGPEGLVYGPEGPVYGPEGPVYGPEGPGGQKLALGAKKL